MYDIMADIEHDLVLADKLVTVCENAALSLEFYLLAEAGTADTTVDNSARPDPVEQKKKFNVIEASKKWFVKIQEAITKFINYIRAKFKGGDNGTVTEDIPQVIKYAADAVIGKNKDGSQKILNAAQQLGGQDAARVVEEINGDQLWQSSVTIKKGTNVSPRSIYENLSIINKATQLVNKYIKNLKSNEHIQAANMLKTNIGIYMRSLKDVVRKTVPANKFNKNANNQNVVTNNNNTQQQQQTGNESWNGGITMTKNEYIASIMLEAADLLQNDVKKDDADFKEPEEIGAPAEEEQDEYYTDASGGEGPDIDLAEISDLCDGDKEVIDLLTDDEDKSATVDLDAGEDAVHESAFGRYSYGRWGW